MQEWDQQDGEGNKPYTYFLQFRAQPPPRSLKRTSEITGVNHGTMRQYSSRFRWQERASAWDAHIMRAHDSAVLAEAVEVTTAHVRALRSMRELGEINIDRLLARTKEVEGAILTAKEALALVKEAICLERLLGGEATERVEQGTTEMDLNKLNAQQLWALRDIVRVCSDDADDTDG